MDGMGDGDRDGVRWTGARGEGREDRGSGGQAMANREGEVDSIFAVIDEFDVEGDDILSLWTDRAGAAAELMRLVTEKGEESRWRYRLQELPVNEPSDARMI